MFLNLLSEGERMFSLTCIETYLLIKGYERQKREEVTAEIIFPFDQLIKNATQNKI